jgi:cell division septation protein DedD
LGETSGEDIDALDVRGEAIYLSTQDVFSVNGLSGADEDVFVCAVSSLGAVTVCNYWDNLYFDGSTWGLDANDVDAFNYLISGTVPTATPTNTATSTGVPPATNTPTMTPTAGAPGILTFTAVSDARVVQTSSATNYGTATTLQVDGDAGAAQTSFIRFNAGGISGPIQSAKLLVYCTTNSTNNGPAAYLANSNWAESGSGGITWNTQPPLLSGAFDNKGAIATNSWVEYDVTSLVTTNGTYTFALVADSSDGIVFSSREGTSAPQLVVAFGAGGPTSTPTQTATQPPAATVTPTATTTSTEGSPATSTPTPTASATPTQTTIASTFTFVPTIDSYVDASNPSTNYSSLTSLRVDGSPIVRSYLRFNVEGLSGNVARATLLIYANSASNTGFTAHSVSDNSWFELIINYDNAPPMGDALGSSGAFTAGTWVRIDVTPYITGNAAYSFGLTTPGTTAISLASSESGANAPQLIIETAP